MQSTNPRRQRSGETSTSYNTSAEDVPPPTSTQPDLSAQTMYHTAYVQQNLQYPQGAYQHTVGNQPPSVQYSHQQSYAMPPPSTSHVHANAAVSGTVGSAFRDPPFNHNTAVGDSYGGGHASAQAASRPAYGSASPSTIQAHSYGNHSLPGYGHASLPAPSARQVQTAYQGRSMTYPAAYVSPYTSSYPVSRSSPGAFIPTPAQTIQSHSAYGATSSGNIAVAPASAAHANIEQRYPCAQCDRTFSRAHDRKRHFESQHLQTSHNCQYCGKEFSRTDSLKRHIDNGCGEMPASQGNGS
ncbi:hypothetical protein OBBRIDRAFT_886809 [Obba rivulosa]|uniref:C2H2-type domain-containing protein n=1 Tax=Obba rivulosa TaxID=1052685 RepID=A0A8E2B3P6_9APHY|nr:hypothetical protein OBBRIDRAFT_886809 [Obba rivulosa]